MSKGKFFYSKSHRLQKIYSYLSLWCTFHAAKTKCVLICDLCQGAWGKRNYVASKEYGPMHIEGPEFETIGLIGPNYGVGYWEHIIRATQIFEQS